MVGPEDEYGKSNPPINQPASPVIEGDQQISFSRESATDSPGFRATLYVTETIRYGDARVNFWNNLVGDPAHASGAIEQCESSLIWSFSNVLVQRAIRFRLARSLTSEEKDVAFSFRIETIKYGSLVLDVSILGIGPFLKFFFNNPDMISAFLEEAVPQAVEEATPFFKQRHPLTRIQPNKALVQLYGDLENIPEPSSAPEAPASGWAKVFQLSSRIPYLLPIFLALAVLFVAANLVNAERDRLKEREAALDVREKEVGATEDARLAKLEALTLDLVRQLRAENPASGPDAASTAKSVSSAKPHPRRPRKEGQSTASNRAGQTVHRR